MATADPSDTARALDDRCALWEAVCRVSADHVIVLDRDCRIRYLNRPGDGHPLEALVDRRLTEFVLPESASLLAEAVGEVFATAELRSLELMSPPTWGGINYYRMQLGPVLVAGRVAAVMACSRSILPLKETERSLEQERNLLRRLIDIQERERQLVSYEIHDGLAQYLAGAIMHLQAWEVALGDHPGMAELHRGVRLLQAAADEARRLISGLRPPDLDELGIIEAIESLVADARTEIPTVTFRHDLPAARLPSSLETTIFRIVQESLSNARKHAGASTASVEVVVAGDQVRIRVTDDGCGFEPGRVAEDRFGLEGIRQRARLCGGEPLIRSRLGGGTTVEVSLPIPCAADKERA
ncbi:MAG: Signal transduction histidine-protein kinase/phosphatase DegS [Planctomycetota bacterium]|jgi:signal transduction histidine kinase